MHRRDDAADAVGHQQRHTVGGTDGNHDLRIVGDQGVAFAQEVGLDPVVTVGEGSAAVPSVRNPTTFSATAARYRLPPPALDEHGDELRRWLREPHREERSA